MIKDIRNPEYFNSLKSLFESDPLNAIAESQKIICRVSHFDSYNEFLEYHTQNSRTSTCQNEWCEQQMSIHCFDCSLNFQSCICLSCFLNGDHKGHNYTIRPLSVGNCDCGDSSQLKPSGFCHNHQGLENENNPENYLNEDLRTALTDLIFKAAFLALIKLSNQNDEYCSQIVQFISSFLRFGDGFRRLIAISLITKIDFENLIFNITEYSPEFNKLIQQLCGNLINDYFFICNFSKITYNLINDKLFPKSFQVLTQQASDDNYSVWNSFWFHSFSRSVVQYNIIHNNWDWVSFGIQFCSDMKSFFSLLGNPKYNNNIPNFIACIIGCFEAATQIQPNEQTQLFFDNLFTEVLSSGSEGMMTNNTIVPVSFKDSLEKMYYFPAQMFNLLFYPLFDCFKSKNYLQFDEMFDQLAKLTDLSPIFMLGKNSIPNFENKNDYFIMKYIKNHSYDDDFEYPSYYYESFHNGASYFFSLPLYDSFVQIFNLDCVCKARIAQLLLDDKYQDLRIKLGIITLKKLLSFVCFQQSLTPKNNFALTQLMFSLSNSAVVASFSVSKYLPLFQLLIGLKLKDQDFNEFSIKEFFAFEMGRELGIFDNYLSDEYKDENIDEKSKQMLFCFLYYSILIYVERILFNFNRDNFIQEQLVAALKNNVSNLNDLSNAYDKQIAEQSNSPSLFDAILSKIATPRNINIEEANNSQDVSYVLKDGIKWNTVSAIIPLGDQKTLLNNELTKNPESLIAVQDFEPEEIYFFHSQKDINSNTSENNNDINNEIDVSAFNVSLKDFLLTPTVLATTYHTLRTNSISDSHVADLNDHFAMNILILISKFMNKNNDDKVKSTSFDESTAINYSALPDLVDKLKKTIFNYKTDSDGNASIENTLDNKAFATLLKIKISFDKHPPLSFIDILQEKGKIGKDVFNQISDNLGIDGFDNQDSNLKEAMKENQKKVKKNRANKLKDEIMNHYKSLISNYTMSESDNRLGSTSSFDINSSTGVINYDGDFCSVCSTNKKNEALSYPIFIYQTKIPFIIDKPPEAREGEKLEDSFEITTDDDAYLEGYKEVDPIDDQDINEDDNYEKDPGFIRNMQLLNSLIQSTIADRDANRISNEDLVQRYQLIQNMRQEIILQVQLQQQQKYLKKIREKQKAIIKERSELFEQGGGVNLKGKRFTAGANFVLQFQICQHLLHPNCIDSRLYNCPIDRSLKNGFLPCLDRIPKPTFSDKSDDDKAKQVSDSLSYVIKNSITVFLNNFKSCISNDLNAPIDVFVELVKSISGLISTYEVRLRSLPDCLDSNSTKILSRNLFLAAWYAYRVQGKPKMTDKKPYPKLTVLIKRPKNEDDDVESDVESRLTVFQKFIKNLIECDDIEDRALGSKAFCQIVNSFINSEMFKNSQNQKRNEKELCLFLRRVYLADYFLLDNQNISIKLVSHPSALIDLFDWDESLTASNLSEKYGVHFTTLEKGGDFEFKPFTFAKVPKNFLHFALPPYKFPVEKSRLYSLYNLLDYNKLIESYNEFDDLDEDDNENNNKDADEQSKLLCCADGTLDMTLAVNFGRKHYPTPFLYIGKNASKIILLYHEKHQELFKPFYLDKYGSADIGFKREQPLFLNEERYERFVDEVLSGTFL